MKNTLRLNINRKAQVSSQDLAVRAAYQLPALISQIFIGQLLGDAFAYRTSPTANTRLEWSFGEPYGAYAIWFADLIKPYWNTSVRKLTSQNFRLKTVTLSQFNYFHDLFYVIDPVTGSYVKIVPAVIGDLMTPIVLAHLLISDGSFNVEQNTVFIYTNAFTKEDCWLIAQAITRMGIKTTLRKDRIGKDGNQQYKLAIGPGELTKLRGLVGPHMFEGFRYRLGE